MNCYNSSLTVTVAINPQSVMITGNKARLYHYVSGITFYIIVMCSNGVILLTRRL